MNKRGYLHKDIKTRNLLVYQDVGSLRVKIGDLGLVESMRKHNKVSLVSGTPGFIAPEILRQEEYSEKCDIFSAGVVLYFILTCESLFKHQELEEVLKLNKECDISTVINENDLLNDGDREYLRALLESDPSKRPSVKQALNHDWFKYQSPDLQ